MDLGIPRLPRRNVEVFYVKNGSVITGIPFLYFFLHSGIKPPMQGYGNMALSDGTSFTVT